MDRCLRAPVSFAVAKCVACVSTCLHEETGNQRPLHLEFSACAQRYHATRNQLRSRTASTWISLYAHRDMFLQNDCCELAPPDRLMHTKMQRFRHGGTPGSQSTCKKTWISIMINKQVHAIKNCCVLALRDLTPCAMRHLHATRLLRSHAASALGSLSVRKETCSCDAPNIDDF